MDTEGFAKSALGFTRSPLGIIALFIVLVYGFASLVVGFGPNIPGHITPLIYFMVLFPVLVFAGFLWLVAKHHRKLYGPSDFRDEDNFLKAQIETAASLGAAAARDSQRNTGVSPAEISNITRAVVNMKRPSSAESARRQVLWVDDNPQNNAFERAAFEAQGVDFTLVRSTDEALDALSNRSFAAIISDMGRAEGPLEGFVLLDALRARGDRTPYIIYAGSKAVEYRTQARERGATGCTNRADELFELVLGAI